jgi:2-methylaconitate cis-trans-isomerase PrpF
MRKDVVLRIFDSPDRIQIDGLKGTDLLTSQWGVIGPFDRDGADADYTSYNIGIKTGSIKPSFCVNVSAAVGTFTIDEDLSEKENRQQK